jgi:hypothetical protein
MRGLALVHVNRSCRLADAMAAANARYLIEGGRTWELETADGLTPVSTFSTW